MGVVVAVVVKDNSGVILHWLWSIACMSAYSGSHSIASSGIHISNGRIFYSLALFKFSYGGRWEHYY